LDACRGEVLTTPWTFKPEVHWQNRHEGESAKKREQLLVEKSFSRTDRLIRRGAVKRASLALLA